MHTALEPGTINRLLLKLENFTHLSGEERAALENLSSQVRIFEARQDIVREGDPPSGVNLMIEGFACRYKTLRDGRRQIIAYFIPGDFCDLRVFVMKEMDHTISTITPAVVAQISHRGLLDLADRFPRIVQALWWWAMADEAITREWLFNVGTRSATERLAHLICEYFLRMRSVGLTVGMSCDLPVTQAELAETVAVSAVHVNRCLQDLRAAGLIELRGRNLTILDLDALQRLALFNPNYLHFSRANLEVTSNDLAPRTEDQRAPT
jgi:CRP-like cAMP-binding protein